MREIIRAAAVASVLSLSACGAASAFAQVPSAPAAEPCVSVQLAAQRLEAAGIEVLGASHAPFTGNELLFLRLRDTVVVVAVIDGCVTGDPIPVGIFKAEFGI
jgi:uncharacterized membrane protein